MNRFEFLAIIIVAGLCLTGCKENTPPSPKPVKRAVKAERATLTNKPARKPRGMEPGSLAYLDAKDGFRDVRFGIASSSMDNLVLVQEDADNKSKTFTRIGDELMLDDVPLETIEYTFFEDRLCQVVMKWKVISTDEQIPRPQPTKIPVVAASVYGKPTRRTQNKDENLYVWRGRKVGVMINELFLPGVKDVITKGDGWKIPPTTVGKMLIYRRQLERESTALTANEVTPNSGGL